MHERVSPFPDATDHPSDGCAFCQIVTDDSVLIVRDGPVAAFLDHRPLFPGHLLVVPVDHIVTLDQIPAEVLTPLFLLVQRAARAMRTTLGAEGVFVANNTIVSQSVLHAHVHVVPRTKGDGLRGFFWPRVGYDDAAHAERVADALREALG